jgi:hypothetical protein
MTLKISTSPTVGKYRDVFRTNRPSLSLATLRLVAMDECPLLSRTAAVGSFNDSTPHNHEAISITGS